MQYRRFYQPGGCYFFTVVTHNRQTLLKSPANIALLKNAFREVIKTHPFELHAAVILPDHLHCIWVLPGGDCDFSTRWRLIKTRFSKGCASSLPVWQNRFWEHVIADEKDYRHHLDYIHFNPVKHGYVNSPVEWPYSSFHKFIARGFYAEDWGRQVEIPGHIGSE